MKTTEIKIPTSSKLSIDELSSILDLVFGEVVTSRNAVSNYVFEVDKYVPNVFIINGLLLSAGVDHVLVDGERVLFTPDANGKEAERERRLKEFFRS